MKITSAKGLPTSSVPVFVLRSGEKIERHNFFKGYKEKDREYLRLFREKNKKGEYSHLLFLPSGRQAMLFQLDGKKTFSLRNAITLMRRVVVTAKKEKIKEIAVQLEDFIPEKDTDEEALAELMAAQFEIANFEFMSYKTRPKEGWNVVEHIAVFSKENSQKIQSALGRGKIIGEEINKARTLSNTPGGDMTPARLAEAAVKSGREAGFKVKILQEKDIKKLNMGGVLGVSKGSSERPRFIVMEYMKGKRNEKPVVLIGKGVTFDTGGLNLKPSDSLSEMHLDMSGGAAVIHIITALARLKIKKNIVGLVPVAENMISGSSYHPGDVLKTMSGKTIEVLNTDAEGRVILSDALEYSKRYKPRLVVDIATLTGAAMSALGQRASAIFTTDPKIEKTLRETGEQTGDYVWPLPLWEEFEDEIKGTFGDFANIGKTRYGGAITGAVFLWQFIKGIPWVHIDIAPRMTAVEGEFLAKGAAGASIGLLTKFLREF